MPQTVLADALSKGVGFFMCLLLPHARHARHRVRRNVVEVGKPRDPVDQIIPCDDGSTAEFAGAQPLGGDFFAELRGADIHSLPRLRTFRKQWAVVLAGDLRE